MSRARALDRAISIVAILSALVTLAFVGHAFVASPQNPVAAEMAFEALRVARRLPLYVDPWVGAWEDGALPSRYFVLYTPIFPSIVGYLSAPHLDGIRMVGRIIAIASWLVVHIGPVVLAAPERRRTTAIAAALLGGVYFTARHAASMSPDTLAAALLSMGALRASRRGRCDALSALLVVAAPFVKPSCIGGAVGMASVHVWQRRPGWARTALIALAAALVLAAGCHYASDGRWLANLVRSTGQPLTMARWREQLGSRFFVLGAPHLAVAWLAWRRNVDTVASWPLLGSLAWTTFIMAKHGSGAHYWLEPTGLALVAVATMPARPVTMRSTRALQLAFGLTVIAISWPLYLREPRRYADREAMVRAVDRHCIRSTGDFVASSDIDLELRLNGRISVPAWQSAFLAKNGRFPVEAWRDDLVRPQARWLVLASDPRGPSGTTNDEAVEGNPFRDVLGSVLATDWELDANVGGMLVFRRKGEPQRSTSIPRRASRSSIFGRNVSAPSPRSSMRTRPASACTVTIVPACGPAPSSS